MAKEYQFSPAVTLSQIDAIRLGQLFVDFRGGRFLLHVDIYTPTGTVAETREVSLDAARLDQLIGLIVAGTLSQTSFEEALLEGVALFDAQVPNDGTIVDV